LKIIWRHRPDCLEFIALSEKDFAYLYGLIGSFFAVDGRNEIISQLFLSVSEFWVLFMILDDTSHDIEIEQREYLEVFLYVIISGIHEILVREIRTGPIRIKE
jgi:hypothetical protein